MLQEAGPRFLIEPLMADIIGRLVAAIGPDGQKVQAEISHAPMREWHAQDAIRIVRALRSLTSDEFLGLGASRCSTGSYRVLADITVHCTNLRDALTMGFRYKTLATSAVTFTLHENERQAVIEIAQTPSERDPTSALSDWSMVVWHKLTQWLIGGPIEFEMAEFAHPLDTDYSSYVAMFGCECFFDAPASRLVFNRTYLDRSITRDSSHARQLSESTYGYPARPPGLARNLRRQIETIWQHEIDHGEPPSKIDMLAEQFGISAQTLRRRLKQEGISYRSLKAQMRSPQVHQQFADNELRLSDEVHLPRSNS